MLAVPDARESAKFYVDVLGFQIVDEPTGWVFVGKDNCLIMLGSCPDDLPPAELGCHSYFAYLVVENIDAYYEQIKAKRGQYVREIEDQPWGMREFGLTTPDGHRIRVGQRIPNSD